MQTERNEAAREMPAMTAAMLPVAKVTANPDQPRKRFEGIEELAESIAEHGLLQPITVRPQGDGWQIVAGERRYRAVKSLGWRDVPALIRDVSDEALYELSVLENVARQDMDALEEATAYGRIVDAGMEPAELERRLGLGRGSVALKLNLLKCNPTIQHLVRRGQVSQMMGWQMGRLTPDGQVAAMHELNARKLTALEFTQVVNAIYAREHNLEMFTETKVAKADLADADRVRQAVRGLVHHAKALEHVDPELVVKAMSHDAGELAANLSGVMELVKGARAGLKRGAGRRVAAQMAFAGERS